MSNKKERKCDYPVEIYPEGPETCDKPAIASVEFSRRAAKMFVCRKHLEFIREMDLFDKHLQIMALREENEKLSSTLRNALAAMIWATGSGDFARDGKADVGARRVLFPAIEKALAILPDEDMDEEIDECPD